ncbi:chaperonin-like RbcX protein 2, chloroplastic [Solanum lycopersicum]|uniref:chaperonin-like RbcX protein 2, chloroplastic n=1 Tax=Solanum lycopersicum TaxID=4081 RepID=UPI0002762F9A|nr:chaperonin-like RbcX protein 2, chloroplastic [Solanum lycopersicum]
MVGTISGSGRSLAETHSTPCLCLNPSRNSGSTNFRSNRELGLWRTFKGRKQLNLSSSFLEAWCEWRLSAKMVSLALNGGSRKRQKIRKLTVVGGLEVEDDDSGEDVKNEIINVITYKAVRTVLQQLYEMNPPQYTWFYNFIVNHVPNTGKNFLQQLFKEKRELAERVMITRLSLYSIWMQKCDHAELYNRISDENVELMRERLAQTVIWPSDDDQIAGSLD